MPSIFPDGAFGGKPTRNASGALIVSSPQFPNVRIPASDFTFPNGPPTAYPLRQGSRWSPARDNAVTSELLALAEAFDPDGAWDNQALNNLATAVGNWKTGVLASIGDDIDELRDDLNDNVATLTTELAGKQSTSEKGQANGYCPLDGTSKISSTYLPSYVDDVIEAANYAALPVTGSTGVIYVTLDTNLSYRWSGSAYVQIDHGDVTAVASLTGNISASALKTALSITLADITDMSANGRSLVATTYSGMRTALGLVIGTDVQAYNANLAAIAGLTTAADKLTYWTGSGTASTTTLSSFMRTVLDDADAATARTTLGVDTAIAAAVAAAGAPTEWIYGCQLSNNGSDANNDIDISTGAATGNSVSVTVGATITKQLDAAWAAGTNAGGLDTGAKANSTGYHVWLIRKNSDGTADALFSTSATSPTVPAGYTKVCRIGALVTDGSGNIRPTKWVGKRATLTTVVRDVNVTGQSTAGSRTLATMSLPGGLDMVWRGQVNIFDELAGYYGAVVITSPYQSDVTSPWTDYAWMNASSTNTYSQIERLSNSSKQIGYRVQGSSGTVTIELWTFGWEDFTLARLN